MPAVMTFYRFVRLDGLPAWRDALAAQAAALGLRGTILLAAEGINATLAGRRESLDAFRADLTRRPELTGLVCRFSTADADNPVFDRLKVRIKAEIVRLDQPGVAPDRRTGEHVDAQRWNALLDDPEVLVLDTRNAYEIELGTFPGARRPGHPVVPPVPRLRPPASRSGPPPSGRHVLHRRNPLRESVRLDARAGFRDRLSARRRHPPVPGDGPRQENRWQGECFVFDQRVSVPGG
jgi:UPF0176 protein